MNYGNQLELEDEILIILQKGFEDSWIEIERSINRIREHMVGFLTLELIKYLHRYDSIVVWQEIYIKHKIMKNAYELDNELLDIRARNKSKKKTWFGIDNIQN